MAKKIKVETSFEVDGKKNKIKYKEPKKNSCFKSCCCCLTSILIILVLLLGCAIGGGIFAYNKFLEPIVEISFGEAFNVLVGLYKADEKKIVTNPFDAEKDLAALNANFKKALFIAEDSDFNITDLIKNMAVPPNTEGNEKPEITDDDIKNNEFLKLLAELKFDFNSLKDYEGEKNSLEITDKQAAALINEILKNTIAGQGGQEESNAGMQGLLENISVKQAVIKNGDGTLAKDVEISVTMAIAVRDLAIELFDANISAGNAIAEKAVKWAMGILPKNIYITMTIYPNEGGNAPKIVINQNSEKVMNDTMKLINGIMNQTGGTSGEDLLGKTFDELDMQIKDAFSKINEYVNLNLLDSKISVEPISVILNALQLSDKVTEQDFLYMIKHIKCVDISSFLENVYDKAASETFFNDFKLKLGIDTTIEITNDNFAEFVKDVANKINFEKINLNNSVEDMRLSMTYDALAGVIDGQFKKSEKDEKVSFAQGQETTSINILENISVLNIKMTDVVAQKIQLTVNIDVAAMAQELKNGTFDSLITAILPENIIIEAEMSLISDAFELRANGLTLLNSEQLFNTLSEIANKLAGEDLGTQLSYDKICQTVKEKSDGAVNDLKKINGLDIDFMENAVVLPSIYEVMRQELLQKGGLAESATADDMRMTLVELKKTEEFKEKNIVNEKGNTIIPFSLDDRSIANLIPDDEVDGINYKIPQVILADMSVTNKLKALQNSFYDAITKENNLYSDGDIMIITIAAQINKGESALSNLMPNEIVFTILTERGNNKNAKMYINNLSDVQIQIVNAAINYNKPAEDRTTLDEIGRNIMAKAMKTTISGTIKLEDLLMEKKGHIENGGLEDNYFGKIVM